MLLRMVHTTGCSALALLCAMASVDVAYGQAKDSTAPPNPVVVGGFVDSYFSFNFARPASHANLLRNFDVTENQFTVSAAEVSVTKAAAPVGFRLDLDFGPTNDIVQSGEVRPGALASIANIGQAYVTWVAPVGGGLTIDAGKFVTHMGLEVIKARDDYNYSRSLLFALSIPYYHYGVRASYPLSSTLTVNGYVYNCYNGIAANSGKTFGFEGTYAPSSALSLIFNWVGGPALPDSVSSKFRNVANAIITFQASEKLLLAIDAVYGQDHLPSGVALWKGAAGYVRYALCDPSSLTLRGELYSDPEGFTSGVPQDLKEITLTYEYKGLSNLILRTEYRYDWSDQVVYDGAGGPLARRNESTLAVGAIVVF